MIRACSWQQVGDTFSHLRLNCRPTLRVCCHNFQGWPAQGLGARGEDELEDNLGLFMDTGGWRGWVGVAQTLKGWGGAREGVNG
jgi:hypothetical protein